jgi:spore coat protein U-like protein
MRNQSIATISAAVLLALAGSAQAGQKTTTFNVSASVASNCVVSATNLGFGAYDGSAALTGTSGVTVKCTNGVGYDVKLSAGGGSYATRLLTDGSNTLEYNLYTSAANTTVWGNGTSSTGTVPWTGTGLSSAGEYTHTVYGTLPNNATNQTAPVGSYGDTITVTVDY